MKKKVLGAIAAKVDCVFSPSVSCDLCQETVIGSCTVSSALDFDTDRAMIEVEAPWGKVTISLGALPGGWSWHLKGKSAKAKSKGMEDCVPPRGGKRCVYEYDVELQLWFGVRFAWSGKTKIEFGVPLPSLDGTGNCECMPCGGGKNDIGTSASISHNTIAHQ